MELLHNIGMILVFLVGIEHIAICYLEIFASPETQAKVFNMSSDFTKQESARLALANQGVYNGMLGLMIIIVFFMLKGETLILIWQLLMGFIIVVAAFGGFTATKKIFVVQMLPAIVALGLISL
ncbi:DUF1304 domain-containing protein [Lactobacillus sp. PSON]|uniref:DUF1304 domain-containing protein n=1 Tax=Lactobacillus sp. PSON TaxID=3455454 RepID=UPI004040EF59